MFVKVFVLAGLALLLWSAVARPSGAHGRRVAYRVNAHDTLWTIAAAHYRAEDVRGAIWKIERANHLAGGTLHPGEVLLLP
jgi:hypothetical protein